MNILKCINPKNGQLIKELTITANTDIELIVRNAHKAQTVWRFTSLDDRIQYAKTLKKVMLTKQDYIINAIADDVGKLPIDALFAEYVGSFGLLNYYIRHAKSFLKPQRLAHRILKNKKSYLHYEPKGVVAVITPWNYPFFLSFSHIISALLAGNAVVYKPSEHTSYVGYVLDELFKEAGFPNNILQTLYGYGDLGKTLVESDIQKVCFTGSVATGIKINLACAERLIPCTLELGGKDPFIVFADAPFERAAKAAIWGSNFNAGQTCSGIERILVEEKIAPEFISKLKAELDMLILNGPYRAVNTLNNEMQQKIVLNQLSDAKGKSKEIYQKVVPLNENGLYNISPTLVIEPSKEAIIISDETFGPVATVEIFKTKEQAIELANNTKYGLTASIWTLDNYLAKYMIDRIDAGCVYVNDHITPQAAPEAPWGGVKMSGIGKSRGKEGLIENTNIKHVAYDRFVLKEDFFWFPYTDFKFKLVKFLSRYL